MAAAGFIFLASKILKEKQNAFLSEINWVDDKYEVARLFVLHFRADVSMSSAHCKMSALRWDRSAASDTCNKPENILSLPAGEETR